MPALLPCHRASGHRTCFESANSSCSPRASLAVRRRLRPARQHRRGRTARSCSTSAATTPWTRRTSRARFSTSCALEARYPFSPETRQAQLDLIYLYYRSQQPESAIDAAEEFERENPTHERIDYCLYMRGLVYFDQAPNIIERMFTRRPLAAAAERHAAIVLDVSGADPPVPRTASTCPTRGNAWCSCATASPSTRTTSPSTTCAAAPTSRP